jgi:1-acyl-sn-glycerol-3-phosphate acyltransferase
MVRWSASSPAAVGRPLKETNAGGSSAAQEPAPPLPSLRAWPRSAPAQVLRELLQRLLLFPLLRVLCAPLVVLGRRNLPSGPVLVVANHGGHADAPIVARALPWRLRRKLAPAAAADYFFGHRWSGAFATLLTGCFPFPRRGGVGLDRARAHISEGWSVLLFPEGTRSYDGSIGEFKLGAGRLAAEGITVLPVGVAGSYDVLPRSRWMPRRAPVVVAIGRPERFAPGTPPESIAATLRRHVATLVARAEAARPARRTWYDRAGDLARSRTGLVLAFCWGVAEALWWPIVPDYAVALLAVAAPKRGIKLALAATAGSVAGGAFAYGLGAAGVGAAILGHTPLVTERMHGFAFAHMAAGGAGLMAQPWSGVPFKVFGYQAAGAGLGLGTFLAWSALARGYRLLLVATVTAAFGFATRRWMPRFYGLVALAATAFFLHGLTRVVAHWS